MDNQRTTRTMGRPHVCRHSSRERKERPERGVCVDIPRMPPCAMNERHAPAPHIVRQWWEDGHSAHSITPQMAHDFRQLAAVMRLYETTDHKSRKRKTKHRAHFSAATTTETAAAVPLGCDFVGDFHEEKGRNGKNVRYIPDFVRHLFNSVRHLFNFFPRNRHPRATFSACKGITPSQSTIKQKC